MKKSLSLLLCLALALAFALPAYAAEPAALTGTIELEHISKYGNVALSLTNEEILAAGYEYGDIVTVSFLDKTLDIPFGSNYSDVDSGNPGLFARAADTNVVLAVNMGDFASTYGIAVKTTHEDKTVTWDWAEGVTGPVTVTICLKEAGGYRDEYMVRQLSYTDVREDFPHLTDAEYANFRVIETTGMGKGVLYRSCSPINPKRSRNTYADAAMQAAGVTYVLNLSDDEETARAFEGFAGSYYASTPFLALNMGVDFSAPDFREKFAEGIGYIAENPGVYLIHCTEGKDRVGFVCAILECLMGASWQEVAADYMLTFCNYYGLKPGDERYEAILNSILAKSLRTAFGVSDLQSADLKACAEAYLLDSGVTAQTLEALKANLSTSPAKPQTEPKTDPAPASKPAENTVYIVKAGDCLWNLAKRFYGDPMRWKRIADANGLRDPYIILIGQSLIIPA